jgi:hypothetical protein
MVTGLVQVYTVTREVQANTCTGVVQRYIYRSSAGIHEYLSSTQGQEHW